MSNMASVHLSDHDSIVFLHRQQLFYRNNTLSGLLLIRSLPADFSSLLVRPQLIKVGRYNGGQCYVMDVEKSIDSDTLISFRSLMSKFSDEENKIINRALQLALWRKQHQYCGQCGKATNFHDEESALYCKPCHLFYYPKISPCMMCLIVKGDYCLLAQHEKHRGGFYSTLAGFVEAGETVEQTVHREVAEEVGLNVGGLDYFSSQAWPFPHQLMIGYFAQYESGDIRIDDDEIVDAQWFHYSRLPEIPPPESLSGMMIEAFVQQRSLVNADEALSRDTE
jgi:NAD+ diphosphatase